MNTSEKTDYVLQYININQNQTNMDFSVLHWLDISFEILIHHG